MITTLSVTHVDQVARLHCATLTGLLTELGEAAARAYYIGCIRSGLATAVVALDEDSVSGFILGSVHPDWLRRAVVKQNTLGTLWGTVMGVLRRPPALTWLIKSFKGPDQGHFDLREPELTYLAVHPQRRKGHIGSQLLEAFTARLSKAGASTCSLSVDADNIVACAFYEKHGFRPVGTYREFGKDHIRYRLSLIT